MSAERIIVVEDEATIRYVLTNLLIGMGFTVKGAGTGQEAMELVANGSFSAALLDIVLPDMSGLDVGERIRLDHPETQVVLLTDNEDLGPAFGAIDSLDLARLGRAVAGRLRTVPAEALTSAPR